jgi:Zn-dependent peptidase ImmA (M78 family)
MAKTPKIPANGEVLRWAREQRGLSIEVAAKRLQISQDRLQAFESGIDSPSVAQLKTMAEKYKRPLIVLLLDEVPTTFTPLKDFRSLPADQVGAYSPELRDEIRRAVTQQEILAELKHELGEEVTWPSLPSPTSDPDELAHRLRDLLGARYEDQREWTQPREAFIEWRTRVEELGILVLEASRVSMDEMRGFSLSEELPLIIVLNGADSDRGKIFTLLHELAHLSLRQPGVCDLHQRGARGTDTDVFCNAVAGEALLPADVVLHLPTVEQHAAGTLWTDEELGEIESVAGGASREAILRRLLQLNRATKDEYEARRAEFLRAYEEFRKARSRKSEGGPPPHRVQLRDRGRPFVRSVFDAYAEGFVTLSEVVDLVGVRTKHLEKLQREAFG